MKEPKKKEEKQEQKKKGKGKIFLIIFLVVLAIFGGGVALEKYLTRTTETFSTVEMAADARSFSGFFKDYLVNRIGIKSLTAYEFREMENAEIVARLIELKEGFSKVSRGIEDRFTDSEYKAIAEILENDTAVFLKEIRELRGVMTREFEEEGDRQLEFIEKVKKYEAELRSGLYVSRAAYNAERSGLSAEGVMIFSGEAMVEVGGGVMNIFIGDVEKEAVAILETDLAETIRRINGEGLYGFSSSRLVKISDKIASEIETGWVREIKVTLGSGEAEVKRKRTSLFLKATWDFKGDSEIKGLLNTDGKDVPGILKETYRTFKGGQKAEEA